MPLYNYKGTIFDIPSITLDLPHIQKRNAIRPIKIDNDPILIGLTREQSWALKIAASGLDLMIEGAGGTGKSHVIRLLIKLIEKSKRKKTIDADINCIMVSPNPDPDLNIRTVMPGHQIPLKKSAKNIVIIDELIGITTNLTDNINKISQIIIVGDAQQELSHIQHDVAKKIIHARNGIRTYFSQIWRSNNTKRTNLCNTLLYNDIYDTPPPRMAESSKATQVFLARNKKHAILIGEQRIAHHCATNKDLKILACAERKDALAHFIKRKRMTQSDAINIVHTSRIQGMEADIFIGFPETDDIQFGLHALGRAKYTSEIILTPDMPVLKKLFLLEAVPRDETHGQNWIKESKKKKINIPPGPDIRAAIRRAATTSALGWNTTIAIPTPNKT